MRETTGALVSWLVEITPEQAAEFDALAAECGIDRRQLLNISVTLAKRFAAEKRAGGQIVFRKYDGTSRECVIDEFERLKPR